MALVLAGCSAPPPRPEAPSPEPAIVVTATVAPSPAAGARPSEAPPPTTRFAEAALGMPGYDEVRLIELPVGPVDVERGRELFAAQCATCHGSQAHGDGPTTIALDHPPPDLTDRSLYRYGADELGVYRTVKFGVPEQGMPPWRDVVADQDLWDVTAFVVRSLQSRGAVPPESRAAPALAWAAGTVRYPSGLEVAVLEEGDGPAAAQGATVAVHYTAWLENGYEVDSTRSRAEPLDVVIGAGNVVPGLEQGIVGMRPGERRRLVIPPELGYGAQGLGEVVPPGAVLIFEVRLVAIR